MEDKQTQELGHFSENELNEILTSFEGLENQLTEEQLDKIQKAWDKVKRSNLYNKQ